MSVAKTGAIPNSYKMVHVAVDSFKKRLLAGRIYHDSFEGGISFCGISEMVFLLEELFDRQRYPMKSVDSRNFNRKLPLETGEEFAQSAGKVSGEKKGALADFILHVKYRYHATWQGSIVNVRDGSRASFLSFMELMDILEKALGVPVEDDGCGMGKRMCEVAVRNYENHVMGGDVSHPAVEHRLCFVNEFELKEQMAAFLNPRAPGEEEPAVIVPRTFRVSEGNFGPATFVVRILFRRNATWQGTVSWKEKRCQVNFRSFLELLLLMQEAVGRSGEWKKKEDQGVLRQA